MIEELDKVVLMIDLLAQSLQQGDIGKVVLIHQDGAGYEVEFSALGRSQVTASCVQPSFKTY